jgi:tellurite resistance protein TerC
MNIMFAVTCSWCSLCLNVGAGWPSVEVRVDAWLVFAGLAGLAIAVDVWILHPKPERISFRAAIAESAAWIALALTFGLWVYLTSGRQAGLEFFAGYMVEKSLSLDNILLFLVVFRTFGIAAEYQHRVLYFGVVGALVMRAAFIFAGIALLQRFAFVGLVFGVILVIAGARMLWPGAPEPETEGRWAVRVARWLFPVTNNVITDREGADFWVKREGKWIATPLFLALIVVEVMDIVFAIDSVPAVLAITRTTFIAYSSNVFAVLGLRAMYFALAAVLPRLRFLHAGLAAILIFTGAKMVAGEHLQISTAATMGVLAGILAIMVVASLLWPKRRPVGSGVEEPRH